MRVAWVRRSRIATANEGDLVGGSRGFSIFPDGSVSFDSGTLLEQIAVQLGHYPERRSDSKGTEPEAIAHAKYEAPTTVLFVGAERGSFVAVFGLDRPGLADVLAVAAGAAGPRRAAADSAPQPARGVR